MSLPDSFDELGFYEDVGFIPELPESLPEEFAPWHEQVLRATELMRAEGEVDTVTLKAEIKKMPKLNSKLLTSEGDLRLAHLQLGILGCAYVHGDNDVPEKTMPECVAVPLCDVTSRLGALPSMTYYSYMSNWRRIDQNRPYTRSNIRCRYYLPGGKDPEEFIQIHVAMEFSFAKMRTPIRDILVGSKAKDEAKVLKALTAIFEWFPEIVEISKTYHTLLQPKTFYKVILVILRGYNLDNGLPNGVVFEGVSEEPRIVPNPAAGETMIFQVLECLLRLNLSTGKTEYFKQIRETRWKFSERKFYNFIDEWPGNVREMAMASSELMEVYNKLMESIKQFRHYHIQLITKFLIIPHRKEKGPGQDTISGLIPYLKDLRESIAIQKL